MRAYQFVPEAHYNLSKNDKLTDPLKSDDTVTVYHNFRDINDAITVINHGLSGAGKVNRTYSYEADNNPNGLFVSPDFKTVDNFGNIIIEFVAQVKDLDPPVWPGGSYTVQGGMSQYWGHGREGKIKRKGAQQSLRQQYRSDANVPDEVKQSDDPLLAYTLTQMWESQALFVGHLNPADISRIFVRKDNRVHSWEEVSKEEFLQRNQKYVNDPKAKNTAKYKVFAPNDVFNPEQFKANLSTKFRGDNMDDLLERIWNGYVLSKPNNRGYHFSQFMDRYLWPKQMAPAFRWFAKTYGNGKTT